MRTSDTIEPDAATGRTYETVYGIYRGLYNTLRPAMHALGTGVTGRV